MCPRVRLMLVDAATGVAVPPQLFDNPFGVATTNPAGNVPVNAAPFSVTVLAGGLVIVNVSVVVPFNEIVVGLNALAIVGGATTVKVMPGLATPVPPSVEVGAPIVLLLVPAVVPVTFTENRQDYPPAGNAVIVPPDRLILLLPATAVIVPLPQEAVKFGVGAITTPAGRLSVNATPLSVLAVFGFVILKLSVLLGVSAMVAGVKA